MGIRSMLRAQRPAAARLLGTITSVAFLAACQDADGTASSDRAVFSPTAPQSTASSGSTSVLNGRATFAESFKVKRKTGDWEIDINAKDPVDVAVQTITFAPGAQSGWHSHPGPVFIQVVSGTMTFYESDDPACRGTVLTKGQGYLDTGEHAHIARNESGVAATNVVTYFAPKGAPLRIDAPAPGTCPF